MKKLLLSGLCLFTFMATSQTILFEDDLESGGGNWTLNGGTGLNQWIINNQYLSSAATFGFVPDTPNQPGGITNSPNSYYLHVYNTQALGLFGISNANFDTGSASNQNATMNSSVSTVGMNNVTVEFWYLCAGSSGVTYGTLQYSTNGGTNWENAETFTGVGSWTEASVSLPAWDNQANFRIRFNWINGGSGVDPSFSVDDIVISATSSGGNSITTTNDVTPDEWCYNSSESGTVNFVATGTFTAGNVYTAQLSDPSGSFAAPTTIGTLASTANGNLSINTIIPSGITEGTGYRVRVVSSAPSTTGTDNGTDIVIKPLPTVNLISDQELCAGEMTSTIIFSGILVGTIYNWENDNSSIGLGLTGVGNINAFSAINSGVNPLVGTITVTPTLNSCDGAAEQFTITVNNCSASIEENDKYTFELIPNPASDVFTITSDFSLQSVELIDLRGRKIMSYDANSTMYSLENIPSGVYIVQILSNGTYGSQRLIVE